jgi:hypothetical protein
MTPLVYKLAAAMAFGLAVTLTAALHSFGFWAVLLTYSISGNIALGLIVAEEWGRHAENG